MMKTNFDPCKPFAVRVAENEWVWSPEFPMCMKMFMESGAMRCRQSERFNKTLSFNETSGVLSIRAEFPTETDQEGFWFEFEKHFAITDCDLNIHEMDLCDLAFRCQALEDTKNEEFFEIVRRAKLSPDCDLECQLVSAGIPLDGSESESDLWELTISLAAKILRVCVW